LRKVRADTYAYYHRMVYGLPDEKFEQLCKRMETKMVDEMAVSV